MKLTRICSRFNYGDWTIHKFGINKDGESVQEVADFRDYFYFLKDEVGKLSSFNKVSIADSKIYKSFYGKDTLKIEYKSIKEKKAIDEIYPDCTFEVDVKPEFKYLIEANYEWADAKDRHILYFDIETWNENVSGFADSGNPFAAITSIQGYSTKYKKYFIFSWHEESTETLTEPKIVEKNDRVYVFCKDEEDTIMSFFSFLTMYNVDIISGWWSAGFDLPYIINRSQRLNIDFTKISPVGNVMHYKDRKNYGVWKTYITGLDHIDMLEAVGDIGYNLSNNKLDTAAKEIIGEDYGKTDIQGWKFWKTDYKEFLKYCIRDVEILRKIDESLHIFDLYCTIQKMTNITVLNDVNFKSSVVDKFIMSEYRGSVVFPTRRTAEKQKYMGAIVLDPVPGLHKDVGVVDYASLYPTSIMSFNLSPETFICSNDMCEERGIDIEAVIEKLNKRGIKFVDTGFNKELFGGRYLFFSQSHRVGLLPKLLKRMYDQRLKIKKRIKNESDPVKLNALDHHQLTLKILLNSAYGAFGFNYFRLYKPEVADAITFFARRALEYAIENIENLGCKIIAGDTDSVFFSQNEEVDMKEWVGKFNKKIRKEFIEKYNNGILDEYKLIELEYEKDLESIYFGEAKKRYYGIEKGTGKKYIRGLNIIRKDAPPFLKERLNELTEIIVRGDFSVDHLIKLREEIETIPYDKLAITKKFTKRFELYEKNQPQHLKAAKFANDILDIKITHRDMPYLFYIKSNCEKDKKPKDRNTAICLLDEHLHFIDDRKDLFELDYDTFFDKQVITQLKEFKEIEYAMEVLEEYNERHKGTD